MEGFNFYNPQHCKIIIYSSGGEGPHDRCRCETVPVNATTQHPSENYLTCYDTSFNSSVSGVPIGCSKSSNEGETQCGDSEEVIENTLARDSYTNIQTTSSPCSFDNEVDDNKQEIDARSSHVQSDSYIFHDRKNKIDAFCQTIASDGCSAESDDETERFSFEHLKDGKEENKKLENRQMSNLDSEPNLQKLIEIQEINPDPVSNCENFEETCKHLKFSTLHEETDGISMSNRNVSFQTLYKEITGTETRQLQEVLKGNGGDDSSASYKTEYPCDSTTWFTKYQRTSSFETESYEEIAKDRRTVKTTESMSFSETCGYNSDLNNESLQRSIDVQQYVSSADSCLEVSGELHDRSHQLESSLLNDETDKQLNGSNSDQPCQLIDFSTNCSVTDLINFDDDQTTATCKEIAKNTEVTDFKDKETSEWKEIDFLLNESLQNSEICYSNKQSSLLKINKGSESKCTANFLSKTGASFHNSLSGNSETCQTLLNNSLTYALIDITGGSNQTSDCSHKDTEDTCVCVETNVSEDLNCCSYKEECLFLGDFANSEECTEEVQKKMKYENEDSVSNKTNSEVEAIGQIYDKAKLVCEKISENTENSKKAVKNENFASSHMLAPNCPAEKIKEDQENDIGHLCQNIEQIGNAVHKGHDLLADETFVERDIEAKNNMKETIKNPTDLEFKKPGQSQITGKCNFTSKSGNKVVPLDFQNHVPCIIMPGGLDNLEPDIDSVSTTACLSFSDMELSDDEDFPSSHEFGNKNYSSSSLGNESGYSCSNFSKSSFENKVASSASDESDSCYASSQRSSLHSYPSKRDLENVINNYTECTNDVKHQNRTDEPFVKVVDKEACCVVNCCTHIENDALDMYRQSEDKCIISSRASQGKSEHLDKKLYMTQAHLYLNSPNVKSNISCKYCISSDNCDDPCCEGRNTSVCNLCKLDDHSKENETLLESAVGLFSCCESKREELEPSCLECCCPQLPYILWPPVDPSARKQPELHFDVDICSGQCLDTMAMTDTKQKSLCSVSNENKTFKHVKEEQTLEYVCSSQFSLSMDNISLQGLSVQNEIQVSTGFNKKFENNQICSSTDSEKGFIRGCNESMSIRNSCSDGDKEVFIPERKKAFKRRGKLKTKTKTDRSRLSDSKSYVDNLRFRKHCRTSFSSLSSSESSLSSRVQKEPKAKSKIRSSRYKSKRGFRKSLCSSSRWRPLCSSSSESSDIASAFVSGVKNKSRNMLKWERKERCVTQQRCHSCNILLTIPNPRCKRHWEPRWSFPENNAGLNDINGINRGNHSSSFKKELSQTNIIDSGYKSTLPNGSSQIQTSDHSCERNHESSTEIFSESLQIEGSSISQKFSSSYVATLGNCFPLSTDEERPYIETSKITDLDDHSFRQEGFTPTLSSLGSESEIECQSDCERVEQSLNISLRTSIRCQRTHLSRKRNAKLRDKGLKLNVFNKKDHMKYQQKVLREYFSNKTQSVKSLVKELYIEHRSYHVFGLGSYFDRLNSGPPPTFQERMQYEWLRLETFQNYTGNGNALALARNGFYHDHNEGPTSTRCFLCEACHSNWEMFDDISAEHRRQFPNCPFHGNREEESVNTPITYGDSETLGRSSTSSSTGIPVSTSVTTSSATSTSAAAVREVSRSLQGTNISQAQVGSNGGESISQQPTEDPESRDRSLLALSQPRTQRALGRSGQSYSTIIAPRRNNVATGARSNVGIDPLNSGSTSSASHPGIRPSSILGGPVGAGAFAGLNTTGQNTSALTAVTRATEGSQQSNTTGQNTSALTAVTRATEGSQQINAHSPSTEAAAGTRQTNPAPGAGGRTDPTITVVVDNPKHPDYVNIDSRVGSYQGWPDYLDQTPRQMSEAGFFFVGVADFTRCFCCGGGLRNWEPGDDPMLEHTRWFPRCEYVNKLKGERYVAAVQRRHQEHMADQQRQQIEIAQRRDENRNPPDPMTTDAAAVMREMGYSAERTREAILAVRRQTGLSVVTTQQVLTWLLDDEERRLTGNSSNTELGIRPPPSSTSVASSVVSTSTPSSVVYTGTSIPSSIVYTGTSIGTSIVNTTSSISAETSIVSAGTTTSTVTSTSTSATAEVQQSSTSASGTSEGSSSETGNQQTGSGNSTSSNSASGSSVEKQSGASACDSDESKSTAKEDAAGSEPTIKTTKKKNAKKKAKNKTGARSETAGATGGDLDAKSLKAENEKLREMQTCKICMERAVNTTLLPCGHLVCCDTCASRLQRCPICRKRIKGTVKTFMS